MKKVARRFALWRADLEGEVCAVPEECVETLRERAPITLVLEHHEFGVTPLTRTFETALRETAEKLRSTVSQTTATDKSASGRIRASGAALPELPL